MRLLSTFPCSNSDSDLDSDLDTQLGGEKSVGAVSVGALSVGVQLVDEGDEDDGLFKAAIMQDENF